MKMIRLISFFILLLSLVFSCHNRQQTVGGEQGASPAPLNSDVQLAADYLKGKDYDKYSVATFAGGCFWCTEASFERIAGVKDVISGYSGGTEEFPTYEQVSRKQTSHAEAIQIYYDSSAIDYPTLLKVFFVAHDPTQLNRQGPDVGPQYRSAIYYRTAQEKAAIDSYIQTLNESGKFNKPIVTEVVAFDKFWVAEGYHQNYYELQPGNSYIQNVSRPKVEKVMKTFPELLKPKYQ